MNNFLQRMLKKSEDKSDGDKMVYDGARQQVEYSPRGNKSNWMRKLGAYSPSKRDMSPSIRSPSRPITPKSIGHCHDYRRRSIPEPLTIPKDSVMNVERPNLEKIVHEFEEGFLSPTKQEIKRTMKSGRFVKQIVAAFEEKYKAYNDYKMGAEKSSNEMNDNDKTIRNDESTVESEMEERTAFMSRTYVIDTMQSRLSHYLDSCETKSVPYSRRSIESIDLSLCSLAMDEESAISTPAKKLYSSSDQRSINSKTIILDETVTQKSAKTTQAKSLVRSDSSMRRERQPKIVGAFLKRPIEVEDTSIDWIPITGKKLPRKKSFKQLLSILIGKKSSAKSSKLYCSQMNLQEENSREFHDSGYDEQSCSSSSLASVASITDLLSQQKNYNIDMNRKILTTFQQFNPINIYENSENVEITSFQQTSPINAKRYCEYDNNVLADDASDNCSVSSKKLLLEEVPRSEVRLSLGHVLPSGSRFINNSPGRGSKIYSTIDQDILDYSLEEVSYENLPPASPLPKHPFVSSKQKLQDKISAFDAEKDVNFNVFGKVELRRDIQSWKFPSSEITYDIPRRYKSKSQPGLVMIGRQSITNGTLCDETVYDVPKPKIPQRPRSSVYEDALSLKRRNANFTYSPPASGFYAFPSQEEPYYATVKPRNLKICPSRELMRSVEDIDGRESYIDSCYGRDFDGIRNF